MKRGGVTVFLTLMFACMMIIISVFFRLAKTRFAKAGGERMLKASMDAVLTEYDRELFRDYRFFFLPNQSEGTPLRWDLKVKEYIEEDVNPKKGLMGNGGFIHMWLDRLEITGLAFATDYENEAVKRQICQWMQYEVASSFIDRMFEDVRTSLPDREALKGMEEDIKEARELASYHRDTLRLLTYVEGVQTNDGGIRCSGSGKPMAEDFFAKSIHTGELTSSNVGVGHPAIWEALREKYWNPLDFINKWEEKVRNKLEEMKGSNMEAEWKGITEGEAVKWLAKIENIIGKTTDAINIIKSLQREGVTAKESICSIDEMRTILESNHEILSQAMALKDVYNKKGEEGLNQLKGYFQSQRKAFHRYNGKDLRFDYASLTFEEGTKNPFDSIASNAGGSLLDLLLVEEGDVSNRSLEQSDARYRLSHTEGEKGEWNAKDMKEIVNGEGVSSLLDLLKEFLNQTESVETLKKGVDGMTKNILLGEYALMHLKGFEDVGKEGEKEAKIRYEQEYTVFGKKSDRDNLIGMANRLMLIRTGMNLLHILTDSDKREKTYATASALVGFTCMEPLVRLTQFALMAGWAWEEAVVDTAALMKGYSVPFIKTKKDFKVKYSEVPQFGKRLIGDKVKAYQGEKATGSLEYRDYVRLFLLGMGEEKKTCRIMDVIQENMKLRYREDFTFDSCLYGFKAKATFHTSEGEFEKEWECAY